MKLLQTLLCLSTSVVVLGLLGCDNRRTVVVREPQPEVVYVQEPAYVVTPGPPPAIIVERRPSAPSSGYIWIDGYQHWDGHRYVWMSGRWSPPRAHAVWVGPVYQKSGREYHYMPGHWKDEGARGGDKRDDRGDRDDRGNRGDRH